MRAIEIGERERDWGAEAARAPDPLPLMSKVPHIKAYFMFLFFLSLTPVHGPYQEKHLTPSYNSSTNEMTRLP